MSTGLEDWSRRQVSETGHRGREWVRVAGRQPVTRCTVPGCDDRPCPDAMCPSPMCPSPMCPSPMCPSPMCPSPMCPSPMWLVRDGEVLATVEVPEGANGRRRGLLGRTGIDGAMLLAPCRNVHTLGMKFAIDVAFCSGEGVVLRTCTLAPRRISPLVVRARMALEAEAGAFDRWRLLPGDRLEIRS